MGIHTLSEDKGRYEKADLAVVEKLQEIREIRRPLFARNCSVENKFEEDEGSLRCVAVAEKSRREKALENKVQYL